MSKNNDNKTNYVAPLLLQAATQINLKKRGLVIKRLSVFVATLFMSVLVAKATSFDYTYQGKTLSYTILTSNTVSVSHSLNHALEGDVVIPPTVTYNGNTYTVTEIANFQERVVAYYNNHSIGNITIPNTVTTIYNGAFGWCNALTTVTIEGNSLTSIGEWAFYNCTALTTINIPSSVNEIKRRTFDSCVRLTDITLPSSITSIGDSAFLDCTRLKNVVIPHVNVVKRNMFLNCKNITNLTINADTIEDDAFYYCDSLQTLVIGDSVKSIGALAFAYCDSLKTVTVGKSVEKFDNDGFAWHNAFAHDYNIETLYYNATNISTDNYSEAFQNTTNLKTVVIGDNVEGLPDGFLSACRYLDTIISYAVNVPTVYENTFGGIAYNDVPRGIPVIVPCGSQQDYRTADYWGTFTNIQSKTYDTTMAMTVCYGDSVNNHIAITSGVIVDTLQSVEGCDSIVTINLTVLPVYSTTIYDSILFDEKGEDYYDTTVVVLQAVNGCDSTVTTITLNDYDNTIDTIINNITMQICEGESYLFDTISVNTSGLYSKTVNVNRYRDSIINLTLVVNPTFDTTINATICQGQSYTLNNFNTNNSGLHLQELLSVNGCDSIVRLNLDVQQGFDTMITVNVCSAGFPSGVFVQNLQSEGGCDSTVRITMIQSAAPEPDTIIVHDTINTTDTLLITQYDTVIVDNYDTITLFDTVIVDNYDTITLFDTVIVDNYDTVTLFDTITLTDTIYVNDTIVPCAKIYTYIYATINEGETYSAFGFNESSAGTYRDTLISEDGCDSIVVLNLSILSSIEDVSKSSSVLLYPNPANDKTRLTFSNIGKAKVELYDTQGRVLKAYDVNDNQRELIVDVNDLAQGSYMITIKTDRMRISKKLIVE